MTGIKPRAAQKYMEECASHCPHCEETHHLRRLLSAAAVRRSKDHPPRLEVACYCAACAGEWVETYDLSSVLVKPMEGPRS